MIISSDDIIIKTIARIFVPFIQLFALYVIMHGHYSPGGGFQGGVILGASLVLLLITHGYEEMRRRVPEGAVILLGSLGLLIYSGIGLTCLLLGGNYLDYSQLSVILHVDPAHARAMGILGIELGVAFAVMAAVCSIFFDISTGGILPEDEK
ncbi:MAG: Na(+)/H(+) antiporter subunit B [Deltaproteobacteria bacterium]|nr:Na(+)/H(+) antiporter subunit B [Deltaproteobacteria bacterium]MBW2595221.1 Na(+)/H(+) antiporter subunit B [Deltaproteobacteria bacterium]MBW2649831.1 Na(+)/H(+) antiporter subunit B [Deltaproteobacteria bacterium]